MCAPVRRDRANPNTRSYLYTRSWRNTHPAGVSLPAFCVARPDFVWDFTVLRGQHVYRCRRQSHHQSQLDLRLHLSVHSLMMFAMFCQRGDPRGRLFGFEPERTPRYELRRRASAYANRAGVPPVCQNNTFWPGLNSPCRIRSINPAMARPVYTGSTNNPSV